MTSTTTRVCCMICGKGSGQFKCEGCSQTFCTKHVVQHRQTLNQQLEEILVEHDVLQQATKENRSQSTSLMAYIEQWEQKSIAKIRETAKEVRQKVVQLANIHRKQAELETLTQRIKTARDDDDFFETDLRHWKSTLEKIKHQLKTISSSNVIKEDKTVPLIYQIHIVPSIAKMISPETDMTNESNYYQIVTDMLISDERFDRCYGNGKIEQNGELVTNGKDSFFGTEIRGKLEYSSGIHEIHFRIENNPSKIWIFIGIISKGTRMGGNLFTPSSVYGWGYYDDYFLAGERYKKNADVFFIHIREDDIIEFMLDCTKKVIRYTIERSRKSQEITVDTNKCPFPWQLFISLGGKGDQIRLLHTTAILETYFSLWAINLFRCTIYCFNIVKEYTLMSSIKNVLNGLDK